MTEFASGKDGHILPARDFPPLSRKKKFSFDHEINPFLTRLSPKRQLEFDKNFKRRKSLNTALLVPKSVRAFIK